MNKINIKIQNIINNMKEHKVEYIAIIISMLMLFYLIWPVIFAVDDDLIGYIVARKGEIFTRIPYDMKSQGRFWFLVSACFYYFPFSFNSVVMYKLISYLSVSFSVFTLGKLLYKHVSKESAILAVLIFFSFAQIDTQHNVLICYIFSHQISIGFVLLSIEKLLSYYKSKKQKDLIWSAFFLFISSVLYETFVLFSVFLFFISLYKNFKTKSFIIRIIKEFKFHIAFMTFYLLAYLMWRHFYPGTYDGAQFQIINIFDSFKTMFLFGTSRFPLHLIIKNLKTYKLSMIEPSYVFKGLFTSITIIFILKRSASLKIKNIGIKVLFCILGMFLPVTLHSLTPKYVEWMKNGTDAYVPSFYSYFFIVAFISILSIWFYQLFKKKTYRIFFELFMFVLVLSVSILTDYNNKTQADYFATENTKLYAFDCAVSSDHFLNIEEGALIYTPEYNGIHSYMPNLDYYASIYSNKQHTFTNKADELTFDGPTYVLHYDKESGCMLMGKLKKNMLVDNIYVASNKPLTNKTALIYSNNNNLNYRNSNSILSSGLLDTVLINVPEKSYQINGQDLNIFNSYIVEGTLRLDTIENLTLGDGFYSQETWGTEIAHWSRSIGKFTLYNGYDIDKEVTLNARVASGDGSKPYSLTLSGNGIKEAMTISTTPEDINIKLTLKPGINEFEFNCDAPPLVTTNGDPRELVFYVLNMNMCYNN